MTLDPEWVRTSITQETHKWGLWLLAMGFAQLIANAVLDPVWGIVLILIGLASFYFRSSAMLPVYGITMAWAAINNVLSGDLRWAALGLLQFYWAIATFREFRVLRRALSRLGISSSTGAADSSDRAAGIFPWAGCALSALAPIGLITLILVAVVSILLTDQEPSEQAINVAYTVLVDSACLGLALGIAGILSNFQRRVASILATVGGGLMLGLAVLLSFL